MSHQSRNSNFSIDGDGDDKMKKMKKKSESAKKVGIGKLFSYADGFDYLLMSVGSIGACVHGASVPVFFIFFGKMINIIGLAYLFPKEASHKVASVSSPPLSIFKFSILPIVELCFNMLYNTTH